MDISFFNLSKTGALVCFVSICGCAEFVVCWRESVVSFGGPSFDDSLYYLSLFVGCVAGVDVDGG